MGQDLKAWQPSDVESPGFLDVRLDSSTTHYMIFTGIAKPAFGIDDDSNIYREEVRVDLGVDVTDLLQYTATVGLASIVNDDSSFVYATDAVALDAVDGRLVLKANLALEGSNSSVQRFSYQTHVKAVITEPGIFGAIRWSPSIETHQRSTGLFIVTANTYTPPAPGQLGGTYTPVANGQVEAAVLNGDTYEAKYSILDVPLHEDLYVLCSTAPDSFTPNPGDYTLIVTPQYAGPYNLSGPDPTANGVDFTMVAVAPPR